MMKRIRYTLLLQGRQLVLWLGLMFGVVAWSMGAFSNAEYLQQLPNYYAGYIALAAVMATSAAIKPEAKTILEAEAALPCPLWQQVWERVAVNWLIILVTALTFLGVIFFSQGAVLETSWVHIVVGYGAILLLFGGVTLWATVLQCDSRIGQISGMFLFAIALMMPGLPRTYVTFAFFPFEVTWDMYRGLWWLARAVYAITGAFAFLKGLQGLQDTDRLLVGARSRASNQADCPQLKTIPQIAQKVLLSLQTQSLMPLPIHTSKKWGLILYETWILVIKGMLPILMLVLGGYMGISLFWGGDIWNVHYLRLWRILLTLTLPVVFVDLVPADRRSNSEQQMLTHISPPHYLLSKLIAGCVAVGITFILVNTIAIFKLGSLVFSHHWKYPAAFLLEVLVSIMPMVIYIAAQSTLLGALCRKIPPLFLAIILPITNFSLMFRIQDSLLASTIFPLGEMAGNTIAVWVDEANLYTTEVHIDDSGNVELEEIPRSIMPMPYLGLLPLSALLQAGIGWFVVSKLYARQVKAI